MTLDNLYLLAAETEGRVVVLKFYDSQRHKIVEARDLEYKPYFFLPRVLSESDKVNVKNLYGEAEFEEKYDLFTNRLIKMTKVGVYTLDSFRKAGNIFRKSWETEVEYTQSYVYDHDLVFGAPYKKEGKDFIMVTDLSRDLESEFEDCFQKIKDSDPQKYAQTKYWFNLLHQPVPQVEPEFLGLKQASSKLLYSAFMLSRIANIPVTNAYQSPRVSDWLKSMIYSHLRKSNFLIPTSEELRRGLETHTVPGALTLAPKAGVYFNTVVCDFESLYPSCIDSYNLSYETVNCRHKDCKRNRINECKEHWICAKRRGFYSILVGALKDLRIIWFKPRSRDPAVLKRERKNAEVLAALLKLISVSSYGVTVRIHGLACPPLAECITGYGRWALQNTWRVAEAKGLHPIYGDTDSIFLDSPQPGDVEWLIKTVKEKLRLDLAIEKRYSLCALPMAKKAYFGILPDGRPDIKGLTAMKSSTPDFIQQVFQDCLKELSNVGTYEEYESAKRRIVGVVQRAIKRLRSCNVRLEKLAYSVKLSFDPAERLAAGSKVTPQPYQCAIQLLEAGRKVDKGDTVQFIKVMPFNYKGKTFTVKPVNYVKDVNEIHVQDYVRNMTTALEQTFAPMGLVLEQESETKISDWFET